MFLALIATSQAMFSVTGSVLNATTSSIAMNLLPGQAQTNQTLVNSPSINSSNHIVGEMTNAVWSSQVIFFTGAGDSDVNDGPFVLWGGQYTNFSNGDTLTNTLAGSWLVRNAARSTRYSATTGNLTNAPFGVVYGAPPAPTIHFGALTPSGWVFYGPVTSSNITAQTWASINAFNNCRAPAWSVKYIGPRRRRLAEV